MPGGSEYQGPQDALARYMAVVEASAADAEVRGAKNPYTARNGHMFSFLDADGTMALRLSDDGYDEFLATYQSGPVTQYGSVMRGYVAVPDELLTDTDSIAAWFDRAYEWIGTLPPKPTKKT
jgi:TfoX N-terminal domain